MFSRWRKIQALGLTRESKDETAPVGKWLHYTFGLTFLPQCVVDDAFVELMEEKPTDSRLDEFCDYLVDYYIDENSNFPPHIWVAPLHCPWRTTNGCEAFHSKFNSQCVSPHPNINVFLKCIYDIQTDNYVKITSLRNRIMEKPKSLMKKL
jgi:hypothetical protein